VNLSECSSPAVIDEILKAWPNVAKTAALTMIQKYGPPDEACSGRLVWHNNGPWRRTVVYAEEVEHNFPTPHHDVLEQYIPYRVPVGKFDQLAAFDGSVLVDRTKGEISARCEGEGGNLLALNHAVSPLGVLALGPSSGRSVRTALALDPFGPRLRPGVRR
jgi:hypothetical protein